MLKLPELLDPLQLLESTPGHIIVASKCVAPRPNCRYLPKRDDPRSRSQVR